MTPAWLAPYEGMLWQDIPRSVKLRFALHFPRRAAGIGLAWLEQVTTLPGDEFYDLRRDLHCTVREVKPRSVMCEVVSGACMAARRKGYAGVELPAYRTYSRTPFGFWR